LASNHHQKLKKNFLIYCFLILVAGYGYSQTITGGVITASDSLNISEVTGPVSRAIQPFNDTLLGAIFPGYGQIYNRKYWKLPIVYGGFLGFAYAISWNNSRYTSYKNAYIDISDNDETTNYHIKILPRGYTLQNYPGGVTTYQARLKTGMDKFRRYRDLSVILSVGYYTLVLLDAFVDAQLYDFDISQDLVLNVAPARIEYEQNPRSAYGLQCSIRF